MGSHKSTEKTQQPVNDFELPEANYIILLYFEMQTQTKAMNF